MGFKCADVQELYGHDSKINKEDVQIIQEWLAKQPHLPNLEESQIILFLHSCYYRIEAAKLTIDKYFTIRTHVPSVFDRLPVDLTKSALQVGFVYVLPEKTPEGYVILMLKLIDFETENFNCLNLIKMINMVISLYLHQNGYVFGAVALFDLKGFTLGHLTKIEIMAVKHMLYYIQEALPVRIKELHFINVVPFMDKIIALVKPFLNTEFYNMLQFHTPKIDTVYQHIPKNCFPKEYGGDAPSWEALKDKNIENLVNNYKFFEWHDTQKIDESRRLDKQKCGSNIFGVEGTFKKLDLD